jgi:hypothetical protein
MEERFKNKKIKTILLFIYAILFFITIYNNISLTIIILLFIVTPTVIYFYVKWIFPKD